MTDLDLNPRYANFCRAMGRSPADQLEHDKAAYPGACMMDFVFWNTDRLREASREIPDAFFMGRIVDHAAYDAWLTVWVDRKAAA